PHEGREELPRDRGVREQPLVVGQSHALQPSLGERPFARGVHEVLGVPDLSDGVLLAGRGVGDGVGGLVVLQDGGAHEGLVHAQGADGRGLVDRDGELHQLVVDRVHLAGVEHREPLPSVTRPSTTVTAPGPTSPSAVSASPRWTVPSSGFTRYSSNGPSVGEPEVATVIAYRGESGACCTELATIEPIACSFVPRVPSP